MSTKQATFFMFLRKTFLTCLSALMIFPSAVLAEMADVVDLNKTSDVFVYVGDLVTLKVSSLTRIAVANPGIVDITNAAADSITLVGRKVGETQIFLWDDSGKRQIVARVLGTDLDRISQRIAALIQYGNIQGVALSKNYYEGKIVLSGFVNKNDKTKLDSITQNFSDSVIDMVVEEGDLIQIDVQFTELDTTLTKAMGFDWTSSLSFEETLPTQVDFEDIFKIGDFSRVTAINAVVNFLIAEGKARILSKPSLVVTNGEEATFLVGGEIPIRTTTTSVGGGSTQENVTFREYGVELTVTPEIRDGKIDISVNVTVRDIDSSNAVGDDVAFLTRTATTKVRLNDGQTIVLAGMIQRRTAETIRRVPFLSKIPIAGILFQNRSSPTPETEQELVVSLTPRLLRDPAPQLSAKSTPEKPQEDHVADFLKDPKPQDVKNDFSVDGTAQDAAVTLPASPEPEKTPAQLKAEKALADKKAKEEAALKAREEKARAKAAAAQAKKEKAEKARIEKQERVEKAKREKAERREKARLEKEARIRAKQEEKLRKQGKPVPPPPPPKPAPVPEEKKTQAPKPSAEDPRLNLVLEDPQLIEPKHELSAKEIEEIRSKYIEKIQKEMSATISYPYEARAAKWEGTAVLDLTITPDGNVKNAAIKQSSGYAVFDRDAVNTAQILAPFDSFAPAKNLREMKIEVPVEYSEKAVLGNFLSP